MSPLVIFLPHFPANLRSKRLWLPRQVGSQNRRLSEGHVGDESILSILNPKLIDVSSKRLEVFQVGKGCLRNRQRFAVVEQRNGDGLLFGINAGDIGPRAPLGCRVEPYTKSVVA